MLQQCLTLCNIVGLTPILWSPRTSAMFRQPCTICVEDKARPYQLTARLTFMNMSCLAHALHVHDAAST